ncbi:MAG: DUF3109 family protein [Prevotellaceae bacterium]|jgi:hypothetical protein|nr:DUF3109 family protein [Prevotellaceae bacterium]
MIIDIDDKLLSSDLFTEYFCCNYEHCGGICCVHGDSGAPLEEKEKEILNENIDKILPYMKRAGREIVEKEGVATIDREGDLVTPLINGEECVFSFYDENANCFCSIESAYMDKKIDFKKPVSCHLYPIRVKKTGETTMLNYDKWSICQCARDKGKNENVFVYEFLKGAIVRCFGNEFYTKLENVNKLIKTTKNI